MQRIVVAAKPGAEQPWVADAGAELAQQTGASVTVVSADGLDVEALSTVPRDVPEAAARAAADALAARIREKDVPVTAEVLPGLPVRAILLYAEEVDADVIVCGTTSRGAVASRLLGNVPLELVHRSRRPVLLIGAPPSE
jgi:nucleotide-binding universal stress UspA family protein